MIQHPFDAGTLPLCLPARLPVTLGTGVTRERGQLACLRERAKLTLRARWQNGLTRRWLGVLNSSPFLGQMAHSAPQLVHKVYRPYLTNTLCAERRLRALEQHYSFVISRGLEQLSLQAARAPLELCAFEGKCSTVYTVCLRAVAPMEREGELVLQLRQGAVVLYSVAFSFFGEVGEHAVNIGCLQGGRGPEANELMRASTRALHGMRPKNLLVGLVRQIGHDLGCSHVHMVGNHNLVVHSALRQGKVSANYDQSWLELGAAARADGDFELDCRPLADPAFEKVEAKRRSEARKRHALCVQVYAAVSQRLRGAEPAQG
ncbi:MAG: DUF535 family protein [Pseudomonadota bacterium]